MVSSLQLVEVRPYTEEEEEENSVKFSNYSENEKSWFTG